MGIYYGQYKNPCKCGGTVTSMFISVGTMSSTIKCSKCDKMYGYNINEEELKELGAIEPWHPVNQGL
jgi:hypothetical protein